MKRTFITSLLMVALFILPGPGHTGAEQNKEQTASAPATTPNYPIATLRRDFTNSFPIPAGEKLEYEIKLGFFPRDISLGVLTFENLGALAPRQGSGGPLTSDQNERQASEPLIKGMNVEFTPEPNDQILHLRATAVSKGMFLAIAGMDVRDRFETLVDLRDFSARLTFKEEKEGKKHIVQSAVYDRSDRLVKYLTTDLNKPGTPPRANPTPLPREDGMMGLLAAIYFVRLQKLKEGQMLAFPVSIDEKNAQIEVLVGKRESLKTDCGKIRTVRVEPKIFGPGRLISRQGQMTMWLSDDSRHTPLRAVAKSGVRTVTAKLLNFKNKCNIIEPDEEKTQKGN